jgi:L-glyceraldehyde 3-phosphate reductase
MSNTYTPAESRYSNPNVFRRCGKSGLMLPKISLGMWHNFGDAADHENARQMVFTAFDHGITHFDLANNYGPKPGSAETRCNSIFKELPRDEMIIATKAGWQMWPGPYGDFGSRKYLIASIDQSLKRLGMDYVDIFYHHRPDPATPLEETMGALDQIVRSGKALYAGISSYSGRQTVDAIRVTQTHNSTPILINQVNYSMLSRWIEDDLMDVAGRHGIGLMCFCPLSQGLLTDKYLKGIPKDSRASGKSVFLRKESVTPEVVAKVTKLNKIAKARGQSLAEMSLQWVLRDERVTSALIGASKPEQIVENMKVIDAAPITAEELAKIDAVLKD